MRATVLENNNILRYLHECKGELMDKSRDQGTYSRHVDEITRKNYWQDMYGENMDYNMIVNDCVTIFLEFERVVNKKFKKYKFDLSLVFYLKQKRALSSCIKRFNLEEEIPPFIEYKRFAPPEIYICANRKYRYKYPYIGKEFYTRTFEVEDERISKEKYSCFYHCDRSDEDRDFGFGFSRSVSIFSYADAR